MERLRLAAGVGSHMGANDRRLVRNAVLLAHYRFEAPEWIDQAIEAIKLAQTDRPGPYLFGVFRNKCESLGCDFVEECRAIVIDREGDNEGQRTDP